MVSKIKNERINYHHEKKMKPIIIGFYGQSQIGKTTLIEKLINDLSKQGHAIAAVKFSDKKIEVDTPGKDTSRFSQAGAKVVILSSATKTFIFQNSPSEENKMLHDLQQMDWFDYIFIEGSHEKQIPKIRIGNIQERPNTILTYNGDYASLLDRIQNNI